jgi:hypothetical protein
MAVEESSSFLARSAGFGRNCSIAPVSAGEACSCLHFSAEGRVLRFLALGTEVAAGQDRFGNGGCEH